jgi:hypothetical protein
MSLTTARSRSTFRHRPAVTLATVLAAVAILFDLGTPDPICITAAIARPEHPLPSIEVFM